MIIALFGVIFSVNIFAIVSGFSRVEATKIGVLIYSVYVAHLFSAAESDIMNPQYKQYETFSSQSNNPNEAHAGISAIVISAAVFAVALFLSSRADVGVWLKLAIVGVVFAALKIFTYLSKIKAFYKENQ
jgi:multisubunit Na+/H+ antiporter MnhC subunit